MEWLVAIAMLCMTPVGQQGEPGRIAAYNFQLKCQKEYIACIEKGFPFKPSNPQKWEGLLKDCVRSKEPIK